jgi:predicted nucleic-acid-binding Zn-ribbon protein
MTIASKCPKCDGTLVLGHSVEFTGMNVIVGFWIEGQAQKSWIGTKVPPESERVPIAAFRCDRCGFLEHYARSEFAAT